MKYYLLSHALGFNRLFDSVEEVSDYVWAKTKSSHLDAHFIKEHLKEHNKYTFTSWGIDISIFKTSSDEATTAMPLDKEDNSKDAS